jgi:hypothetical protein
VSSPGALITVAGGKHLRVLLGTHVPGAGHDGPAVIPGRAEGGPCACREARALCGTRCREDSGSREFCVHYCP